jgi:hypothetical protein
MQIEVGSVIVGVDGKLGIVEKHLPNRPKNPWQIRLKSGGKAYVAGDERFRAVIGKIDIEEWRKINNSNEAVIREEDKALSPPLFGVNVGGKIKIRHGMDIVIATYVRWNPRATRTPVIYYYDGKNYRASQSCVLGAGE